MQSQKVKFEVSVFQCYSEIYSSIQENVLNCLTVITLFYVMPFLLAGEIHKYVCYFDL